jgi:FKBP-type peptidyl-prolyl cis-trans isomerase FkpA
MRVLLIFLPAVLLAQTPAPKAAAPKAAPPAAGATTMTEDQKTIYALGLSIAQSLKQFDLTPAELELVKRGLTEGIGGRPAVELSVYGPKIQGMAQARVAAGAVKEKATSAAYLAKAAAEPGAVKTPSGLVYFVERAGTGASPKATDTVVAHYRGTLTNGTEFDSSYKQNKPLTIPLNQVIKCWTEGIAMMKVGGKSKLVCPSDIAYGDGGHPPVIPGGATLIFEVELLSIQAPGK